MIIFHGRSHLEGIYALCVRFHRLPRIRRRRRCHCCSHSSAAICIFYMMLSLYTHTHQRLRNKTLMMVSDCAVFHVVSHVPCLIFSSNALIHQATYAGVRPCFHRIPKGGGAGEIAERKMVKVSHRTTIVRVNLDRKEKHCFIGVSFPMPCSYEWETRYVLHARLPAHTYKNKALVRIWLGRKMENEANAFTSLLQKVCVYFT